MRAMGWVTVVAEYAVGVALVLAQLALGGRAIPAVKTIEEDRRRAIMLEDA